ncbi:hypothetical protein GGTG_04675 [Gaeumannomyces tritici R3-111a-1]|uniref:Uncharacterized protein n=1 Tax=Gaeumannomyces tritici (strain R3-111a-1) TaxID=644352 RepID=J3NTS6_GAET3|nr:hypothetical protein GGTG_04675 [Gaeumannomyces tritici R3-111a-1]EJT79591.1 hypothetical protein GGTG_04675 [Gaeumannomyces tritici R3-111a-1]
MCNGWPIDDRFNTRSCPIQEFRGFLLDVRECGRDASDRAEFYAMLGRRRDERITELQEAWYDVRGWMRLYHTDKLYRCQEPCCLNRLATLNKARSSPQLQNADSERTEWFHIMSGSMALDAMVRYFDGFVRELREQLQARSLREQLQARSRMENGRQPDAVAQETRTQSSATVVSAESAEAVSDRSSPTLVSERSPPTSGQKANGGPDMAQPFSEGSSSKATLGTSPSTPCKKRPRTDPARATAASLNDQVQWATSEEREQGEGADDASRDSPRQQAEPRNKRRRRVPPPPSSSSPSHNMTAASPGDDTPGAYGHGVPPTGPLKGEEEQRAAAAGDPPRTTLGVHQDPPPHGTSRPAYTSGTGEEARGPPSPSGTTEEEEEELLHATQYPGSKVAQYRFDLVEHVRINLKVGQE